MPYGEALALQRALVDQRRAGQVGDLLLLVEHPHVITLGVRGDGGRSHILASEEVLVSGGVEVHETGRGGDVTYHGPGQLVGYPIIDLSPERCDVHRYVRDLEEVLIRTASDFGIQADRIQGLTGVWVGREKLAAIRHHSRTSAWPAGCDGCGRRTNCRARMRRVRSHHVPERAGFILRRLTQVMSEPRERAERTRECQDGPKSNPRLAWWLVRQWAQLLFHAENKRLNRISSALE